jgi:hypothetical protein
MLRPRQLQDLMTVFPGTDSFAFELFCVLPCASISM